MTPSRLATLSLLVLALGLPPPAAANFTGRSDVLAFAEEMALRHGFDRDDLLARLEAAPYQAKAIKLITPARDPGVRSWPRYRSRFIEATRIRSGLEFWETYGEALARAQRDFGVPEEIVLGIIGVETIYGRNTGNFPLVGALATLAFDYPPRAELFRKELENLFLMARENQRPAESYQGSYAGAIGYPQFLPSSVRNFALDFDGDGLIDLENSPIDAIGSVARYLAVHGWQPGQPVADPVRLPSSADAAALVAAGIEPALDAGRLASEGIRLRTDVEAATLVDLVHPGSPTEYWLGYRNFYVITRYNRSSFYAMAVYQLAQALLAARGAR